MNINNLYFYIHYCNRRQSKEEWKNSKKIKRTLQHHEFLLITAGKGCIVNKNKEYKVREGMLFYICPNVEHSIEADVEKPMSFVSVHFSYSSVSFNNDKWAIRNEDETLPLNSMQQLKDYYQVENIFRKLVETWIAKLPGYEFISKALLQQLTFEILEDVKKQNQNYSTSLKVEKIIKYMHENINSKLTLTELSEMVQLSPTYLSRIFKETTEYSVIGFFNKMKVDKAKELIIEGNKKVKEIAQLLGFTDEFYFSRIFKKIEGISPSEFYNKNVHGV